MNKLSAGSTRRVLLALLAVFWYAFWCVPGLAQPPGAIEEEELATEELQTEELQTEELEAAELEDLELPEPTFDREELELVYAEALELFASADQPASIPGFVRVVEILGPEVENGALGEAEVDLLVRALSYLAQARFNLGELEAAESHLRQLLELRPDFDLDRATVSPKLAERFDRLRRQIVGELALALDPPDAAVSLDGEEIENPAGVSVLAGDYFLEVERPGYGPLAEEIEIAAGETFEREIALERVSPVLRLATRPPGAEVRIDGVPVATTAGRPPEGFLPPALASRYPAEEFSAELFVDALELGRRVLEVRKDGYRPYRVDLGIDEAIDYRLPPIVLDPERGYVVFESFPAAAEVQVDGEPVRLENPRAPRPQLALSPGEYRLHVSKGATQVFTTRLRLADRQTVEVAVRLEPALALLGVLGGDRRGAERLDHLLRSALGGVEGWALVDRTAAAPELLARLGLEAADLRRSEGAEIDWQGVRSALDREVPGLVYVLGVLSDDLVASHADLWLLPAAPGPARPDRLRVELDQPGSGTPEGIEELESAFGRVPNLRRPWVGASVIDSLAAPHPVVTQVTPGSPAAAAGLAAGDEIIAVAQVPVLRAADFVERITAAETGEVLDVAVRSAAGARNVSLELGTSPRILSGDEEGHLDAVVWADLVLLAERADPASAWVVELNQALVQLRARRWEDAVERLRAIRVPADEEWMGRGAVDYWLGVALLGAGPRYQDTAIAAFERAARSESARLYHRDGPWVAPRARARLVDLGASSISP